MIAKLCPSINFFTEQWEYELQEDTGVDLDGHLVVIPKLFSYDGATIPAAAWQALYTPFDPIVMAPALLHDWLYTTHELTRSEADDALADMLIYNGVPHFKVRVIRGALKVFGGHQWEHSTQDLGYIDWLKKELIADGRDPATYHLP